MRNTGTLGASGGGLSIEGTAICIFKNNRIDSPVGGSGTGGGSKVISGVSIGGASVATILSNSITVTSSDDSYDAIGVIEVNTSTNRSFIQGNHIDVFNTSASFVGTAAAYLSFSSGPDKEIVGNVISVSNSSGSPGGSAYGIFCFTGSTQTVYSIGNTYTIENYTFNTAYSAFAAGDTIIANDLVNATTISGGSGTVKSLHGSATGFHLNTGTKQFYGSSDTHSVYSDGTNYIIDGGVPLKWPKVDATVSGYVLKSDAAGVLSWGPNVAILIDVTDSTVAEGNNSIVLGYDKFHMDFLYITTTS
ncbi:unnamed protein product, partial [marine sediment metagenome]